MRLKRLWMRLIGMILLAGGVACGAVGNTSVERGEAFLRKELSAAMPSAGLCVRWMDVLLVLGGEAECHGDGVWAAVSAMAGREGTADAEAWDLVDDWREMVKAAVNGVDGGAWRCRQTDGGWSAEDGARSELGATVRMAGLLADWPLWAGRHGGMLSGWLAEAYVCLLRWSRTGALRDVVDEGGWEQLQGEVGVRRQLEVWLALTLMEREGVCENVSRHGELVAWGEELAERLEYLLREEEMMSEGDENKMKETVRLRWVYEAALLIRGMCVLGERERVAGMVSCLERGQEADGAWRDTVGTDDVMLTCAAVMALRAVGVEASEPNVVLQYQYRNEDDFSVEERAGAEGANQVAVMVAGGAEGGSVSVSVYGETGETVWQSWVDGQKGVMLPSGEWPVGRYRVDVSLWDEGSGALRGRCETAVEVQPWYRLRRFGVSPAGIRRSVREGERVEMSPVVQVMVSGNVDVEGVVRCQLLAPGGRLAADFGETALVMAAGGGESGRQMAAQTVVFGEAGVYRLVAEGAVSAGAGEVDVVTDTLAILVSSGVVVRVEQELEPGILPLGESSGLVRLRAELEAGAVREGIPAAFEQPVVVRQKQEDGEAVTVVLEGVVDQRGRRVEAGWVVVHCDRGHCDGGQPLTGALSDAGGSLTVHEVVAGRCEWHYVADGGAGGWTGLQVYAAVELDGRVSCLGRIGMVEVLLSSRNYE